MEVLRSLLVRDKKGGQSAGKETTEQAGFEPIKSIVDFSTVDQMEPYYKELLKHHAPDTVTVGKALSQKERQEKQLSHPDLAYGEITYRSFGFLLQLIKEKHGGMQKSGGTFYDLGSGLGNVVFAAALLHDFRKCIGIEILERLIHEARLTLNKYRMEVLKKLGARKTDLRFDKDDIFENTSWRDASLLYINAASFSEENFARLEQAAELLAKGTLVITIGKKFQKDFDQIERLRLQMSWGFASVYLLRKKR